jgi:hypothetical protein
MKKIGLILILIAVCFSCTKESVLESTFNCSNNSITNSKRIADFKNKFSLQLPPNWKTELYYNSFQSEIFSADTSKQLSESFILKVSNNLGELKLNESFFYKIDSVSNSLNQELVISHTEPFNETEMYWNVFKGFKNGFTFHQFNGFQKISNNSYINSSVEIYGDENINERLCKAINVLKTIQF